MASHAVRPTPAFAAPAAVERLLVRAELEGKKLYELELIRATPRARAGLVFVDWELRDHFEHQGWYHPGRYDDTRLTEIDRKNLALIESVIESIPRAALLERWQALVRNHGYAARPAPSSLEFSTDGNALVSYLTPARVGLGPPSIWDARTGERLVRMAWPAKTVTRGYFATPYGPRLGTEGSWPALLSARRIGREFVRATSYDVLLGAPSDPQPARGLLIGPNWSKDGGRDPGPLAACIAPDASTLLTFVDVRLRSFDLRKGKALDVLDIPRSSNVPYTEAARCAFFDDAHALVGIEYGGDSLVFDVKARTLTRLSVPRGLSVIAPGGELLALWGTPGVSAAREVTVWDLRGVPKQLTRLAGTGGATNAWFTPDHRKLLVAGARGALTLFDIQSGARTSVRDDTTFGYPSTVPTGQLLPSLVEDAPGELDRPSEPDLATGVAFSPDGSRVAIAYASGGLEMRDLSSGARLPDFRGHDRWSEHELWEASLLARRLGLKLDEDWPSTPAALNPLDHLAALDQPLPASALDPLSRLDLRLLRNTIAARHGAVFKAKTLTDAFAQASWYQPNPAYTTALLNVVDRANIRAVTRREAALGGPLTEAEAVKHTEFAINAGMYDWKLLPRPPEPERFGRW